VVIADHTPQFSLSELLFGVLPACVLPRRVGFQKANYLALMTGPFSAAEARDCGLVDAIDEDSEALLRKHLLRLRCLSRSGISRYKRFMSRLDTRVFDRKQTALAANRESSPTGKTSRVSRAISRRTSFPGSRDGRGTAARFGGWRA
jgi:polyketide biosynthesis enoyl-CoA hydratase PksH